MIKSNNQPPDKLDVLLRMWKIGRQMIIITQSYWAVTERAYRVFIYTP